MSKPIPSMPRGTRATHVDIDGVAYVVLSHPLDEPGSVLDRLSDAQRMIVGRVVDGWSCARIADERGTSPRTVEKQLQDVYRRVGVGSRGELIALLASTLREARSPRG